MRATVGWLEIRGDARSTVGTGGGIGGATAVRATEDIRDEIFRCLDGHAVDAAIEAAGAGILAGVDEAAAGGRDLGLEVELRRRDGERVGPGDEILRISGPAKAIAIAEETLIGLLAKPSGIATATRRLVDEAAGRVRIVGGAWKKAPPATKGAVRHAVKIGGADGCMAEHPMIYLDKNYIRILGGLRAALESLARFEGTQKVVQITGSEASIYEEVKLAVSLGATTVFVDSGRPADIRPAAAALADAGVRGKVMLAYGGGVEPGELEQLVKLGADAVCIGRAIIDAPLLDMRLQVRRVRGG